MSSRRKQCVISLSGARRPRAHNFEQHRRADGIDEARRDRDVSVPECFEMQVRLDPMRGRRSQLCRRPRRSTSTTGTSPAPTASIAQSTPAGLRQPQISVTASARSISMQTVPPNVRATLLRDRDIRVPSSKLSLSELLNPRRSEPPKRVHIVAIKVHPKRIHGRLNMGLPAPDIVLSASARRSYTSSRKRSCAACDCSIPRSGRGRARAFL